MDSHRFDDAVRLIGAARTRRQMLRALGIGAAGFLGIAAVDRAIASGDSGSPGGGLAGCVDAWEACGAGSECCNSDCIDGVCGCGQDIDCPGADTCESGVCLAALCENDSQCGPNQVCCGGTCEMGECCDDGDCPGAAVCSVDGGGLTTCDVVTCTAETDCNLDQLCCGGVCQSGSCCSTDLECGNGSLCCDGACIPCPDGGVCGASGSGICSCGAGEMECAFGCAECCDDTDCDVSEACFQGSCLPTCTGDEDCGANASCGDEVCVCDSGYIDCDGTCAECCTYLDCPGSDICEAGTCVPLCLEAGGACADDADCCSGNCESGECGIFVTELPETGTGPGS